MSDILVIECLMGSSITPDVTSPPCKCTKGILWKRAADAAAKVSYLSPSKINKSNLQPFINSKQFWKNFVFI